MERLTQEKLLKLDKDDQLIVGLALVNLADNLINSFESGPEQQRTIRDICDLIDKLDQFGSANNVWARYLAKLEAESRGTTASLRNK